MELSFEILCVTMNQNDFSKIKEMNIHSNVVFANQCNHTSYDEINFDGNIAKMISTNTHGVGINRNISLIYASKDICLFADDDVKYVDNVSELVINEFINHPNADIFIFNLKSDSFIRTPKTYNKTKKCKKFNRMPFGGPRIAFKLSSIKKKNLWFTTLFGGGCKFPNGEDTIWLKEARKKKLNIYISNKTIGILSYKSSTWFDGYNEKFYFGKGACYYAQNPYTFYIWVLYTSLKKFKDSINFFEKIKWMKNGKKAYKEMLDFDEFKKKYSK